MNLKILLSAVISFIVISSCEDRDDGSLLKLAWDQTKCSDPWGTGENRTNSETEIALANYLEQDGIEFEDIDFSEDSELDVSCEACNCGTGQRIIITVDQKFLSQLQAIGFYIT